MRSIIVVDDEPGIVAVLKRLLANEGWNVQTANDGAEALLLIGRSAPSVLLADHIMPTMDGAALVRALRRDPRGSSIPVVIMSGLPESMVARRVRGYQGFVRKPFVFDELQRVLARATTTKKK